VVDRDRQGRRDPLGTTLSQNLYSPLQTVQLGSNENVYYDPLFVPASSGPFSRHRVSVPWASDLISRWPGFSVLSSAYQFIGTHLGTKSYDCFLADYQTQNC
jgi:hypothetical protein